MRPLRHACRPSCLPRHAGALAGALSALLLGGCDLSMKDQPKTEALSSPTLWPGGPPRSHPPAGTIARGDPARAAALAQPPPLTPALIDRGQARYAIFCAMCHGDGGDGDGAVVRHGFPPPPSYHSARLSAAPPAYIVAVITRGYGRMYRYADRVDPADRWAIAAYVKTLQRARIDREAAR